VLHIALAALFSLAGFESATFFGPEAKRPLTTVTRVVLVTPLICGGLFLFAGWAAWTGRGATMLPPPPRARLRLPTRWCSH